MNEPSNFFAGLTAFSTAGATLAIFVLACSARRRERRSALSDLHGSLTSGETAIARNTIGTLLYASRRYAPSKPEAIEAYFRLMWSLQRARNIYRAQGIYWKALSGPSGWFQRLLFFWRQRESRLALTWNVNEIAENIVIFHDRFSDKWDVEDDDAWEEITKFVDTEEVRRRVARGC